MVLGTNSATQLLAFGVADSEADTVTTQARTEATSICLAKLNILADPASPSAGLTSAANMIAASFINKDKDESTRLYDNGIKLLEDVRGDTVDDADWGSMDVF